MQPQLAQFLAEHSDVTRRYFLRCGAIGMAALSSLPQLGVATQLTGRIISDEGPQPPPRDGDPYDMTRMSPAALLGQWNDIERLNVYRPYLAVLDPGGSAEEAGLEPISSRAPDEASPVNWLNIFYAVEWAVFAGFAFYLWYRLARDAWEKEIEDLEDAQAEAS